MAVVTPGMFLKALLFFWCMCSETSVYVVKYTEIWLLCLTLKLLCLRYTKSPQVHDILLRLSPQCLYIP